MREATADSAPGPSNMLASLLHPAGVWSAAEMRAAHARFSPLLVNGPPDIHAIGRGRSMSWRLTRARRVAAPVGRVLPLPEAPRTSRHLRDALALLDSHAGAAELCELLLLTVP